MRSHLESWLDEVRSDVKQTEPVEQHCLKKTKDSWEDDS